MAGKLEFLDLACWEKKNRISVGHFVNLFYIAYIPKAKVLSKYIFIDRKLKHEESHSHFKAPYHPKNVSTEVYSELYQTSKMERYVWQGSEDTLEAIPGY